MRNTLEYLIVRAILGTCTIAPQALGRFYARVIDAAVPRLRRVGERNLGLAGLPPALIDGVYRSVGRMIWSFARFPQIRKDNVRDWIDYSGFEHYEEAKQRGRGILFATAHLGNWELSAYAHALLCEPMHVVVRPLDNPYLDRFVTERREGSGNRINGKKDFLRGVMKALARNEAVGILIDQNAGLGDGVFINFFGVAASANSGFVKLAHHTGAAVIPGFALWDNSLGRYVLKFLPIVEMTGDVQTDTQTLQTILEAVIRQYPDQWLWIHRRWKTRPPGEPPIY